MSQTAPGRVRIGQQGRCFKLITGGKTEGGLASAPTVPANVSPITAPPVAHTDAPTVKPSLTVDPASAPLMSPEALFMLAWALGVAFGMLFMAFLIRAGVFA